MTTTAPRRLPWFMAALAAFLLGWTANAWWSRPEPPADSASSSDAPAEPLSSAPSRPEYTRFLPGHLIPCHLELAEYRLRARVDWQGTTLMAGSETFCRHQGAPFERERMRVRSRAEGPQGEFGACHVVLQSFPQAVELSLAYDIVWQGTPYIAEHTIFAQANAAGQTTLANGLQLHWTMEPVTGAQ